MPAKFSQTTFNEVSPAFSDSHIKLTKHMHHVWHRFGERQRFHLNSDANRLSFIEWYLTDFVASRGATPLKLENPQIVMPLIEPVNAAGPMNVLLLEVWRKRYSGAPEYTIYERDGYLRFAADICTMQYARALEAFVPESLRRAVKVAFDRANFSVISHGVSHVARKIDVLQVKYENLGDWRTREALNFDLVLHHLVRDKKPDIFASETQEYWSDVVFERAPRLSRMMAAVAALSPRFKAELDTPAGMLENADNIAEWFLSEVLPNYEEFSLFLPPAVRKEINEAQRREQVTQVSHGRRRILQRDGFSAVPGDSSETIDLLVIGPFGAASGLGTGTRRSVNALAETGCNFRVVNCLYDNPSRNMQPIADALAYKGEKPKAVLWHFNAEYLPEVMRTYPEFTKSNRNIGYFFWETEAMPHAHQISTELVDEIWAPSEFCRACYDEQGVPVFEVGTSVDLPKFEKYLPRSYFGLGNEFVFMFSFDSHSVIHRKNPAAVVRAFQHAFRNESDVRLIIKTQNFDESHWGAINGRNEELLELMSHDSRVLFINKTLTLEELYSLKASIDCYVSLHRSEGFGYGPAEAMALGKPTIMTNYSANVEFGSDGASLLVDGPLVHVLEPEYLYWTPEMKWADPDFKIAAEHMRKIYADRAFGAELGARGKEKVTKEFGRLAMARKYETRLAELGLLSNGAKLSS
ncbi:glycosyltransferase family 4 protein [Ensifer adhaerens]|uniref:glycosyltransferase family 4 protein n=1 Tax=Ensifer adhaerens TaxID=106592 RepID=UPI000DDD24A9|nr:glycosyltransferase family 4 protein [Ensifer adhaerens]MBW0365457.1 glycosyltransferase family 4 protein [Ensifer adhaerens]UCM22791.1 glycosyltransferase family 4 protein [Ensifer adhaerens]